MTGYAIKSTHDNAQYTPRGDITTFIYSRDPEVILSGPSETGKTLAACWKLHTCASKYPGAQLAIVRATYQSIPGTVLQTFQKVTKDIPLDFYGGTKPERIIYPNGSTIWVGGLDNPSRVLSSERDIIYVNQAEEVAQNGWEILLTRTTGRAANMPYSQLIGDCNPGGSKHWILERTKAGSLKLLKSYHKDNPTLYDEKGNLTERGKLTMARLESLTGVRRKRLYLGEWATAEGAVYDIFNAETHVKVRDPNEMVFWALACDEGYTNPAVILLVGFDSDLRAHVFSEFYERGKLQSQVVDEAVRLSRQHRLSVVVVDAAANGLIADMRNCGLNAVGAKGRVLSGIALVQDALKVQADGKTRLTLDPSCVDSINDFESYVWQPGKDEPVKDFDHAPDAIRYLFTYLSEEMELSRVTYQPEQIGVY